MEKKETVRIITTVEPELREKAKEKAKELGLSMSALVRMLLIKELEK